MNSPSSPEETARKSKQRRKTWTLALAGASAPLAALLTFSPAAYPQTQNICERLDALNDAGTVCDLSGKGIKSLKAGDFNGLSKVRILHLHNNALTTLPDNVFSGLSSLEQLYLGPYRNIPTGKGGMSYLKSGNPLTSISADAFSGLSKLKHLSMMNHSLTSLPEDVFDGLSNLVGISLYNNYGYRHGLTSLPEDIFDGLSNLKHLFLHGNQLSSLPEDVFDGLSNLEDLGLGVNYLKSLPEDVFDGLSNLKRLYLQDNKLTSLPKDIFNGLSNLISIMLINGRGNKLTCLPKDIFDGLSNLRYIYAGDLPHCEQPKTQNICERLDALNDAGTVCDLSGKGIKSLKAGDFNGLSKVRILHLHNNALTTLPDNVFSGLSSLEQLYLGPYTNIPTGKGGMSYWTSGNPLTSISADAFSGLSKLKHLSMMNNSLTNLPEDVFDGLSNLVGISLGNNSRWYNNNLTSLPENIFDGLSNLEDLSLHGNQLSSLPEDVFDGLSNLENLGLGVNHLKSLPEDVFNGLSNLKSLYLQDNKLTSLPKDIFDGLSNLRWIMLNNNKLTCLPEDIFDGLLNLRSVVGGDLPHCEQPTLPLPVVSFVPSSQSYGEWSGMANVEVRLDKAPAMDLAISYTVGGSSAEAGTDYETLSGTVTVVAGSTSAAIPVVIIDDSEKEDMEIIILTLADGADYDLGTETTLTLTVIDDDGPTVSFAAGSETVSEAVGSHKVGLTLSTAPTSQLTIYYMVNGTATAGTDYTKLSGSVAVAAGKSSIDIPLVITDDDIHESSETITLTLTNGVAYTLGATTTYTLTIKDDDKAGVKISESHGSTIVTEAAGSGRTDSYTVALSSQPSADVSIRIASATPTAAQVHGPGGTAGGTATLRFTPGNWSTAQTVTVTGVDDNVENEEQSDSEAVALSHRSARISHSAVSDDENYDGIEIAGVVVQVVDDDATTLYDRRAAASQQLTVSLSAEQETIDEANGRTRFTISLSRALAAGESATVPYTVTGGTAGDHWNIRFLKKASGAGVERVGSGKNGAVKFSEGGQQAKLTLIGRPDSDKADRPIAIAFGTGKRAPSTTVAGGIMPAGDPLTVTIVDSVELLVALSAEQTTISDGKGANGRMRFTISLSRALAAGESATVPYTVTGGAAGDHWNIRFLKKASGAGVERMGSGKNGAVKFSEGGQQATLALIGRPDSDKADRPIAIAFGTGKRAPSTNVAGGIMPVGNPLTVTIVDGDNAALWVADATVKEDAGLLRFSVHLSAPLQKVVSVSYRTREATPVSAQEGRDYEGASGRLVFQPGQRSKQVPITIIDDVHDEGREIFELVLSNPQRVRIADGVGMGAIVNSDPIPAAWLGRFGRTVSQQVVDALKGRFSAPPGDGLNLTVAGEHLGTMPLEENEGALRKLLGFETVSGEQLVADSSFSFSPQAVAAGDGGAGGGGQWSVWGQGALSSFSGQEDGLSLNGDVTTALVGADWRAGRWQVGAALSRSWGNGSYEGEGDNGDDGRISATLTGLFPYGRYALSPRLGMWATGGYGWGSLTLKPQGDSGEELDTDTNLVMGAVGLEGVLLDGGADGITLTTTTDLLSLKTVSAEVKGLKSSATSISRLRLGLEATRPFPMDNGAALLPSLEVGLRQDSGDAETGYGVEVGAGVVWKDAQRGIRGEVKGRTLLTHTEEEFRQQGLALSFAWDPSPSNRGPSLSMDHTMGAVASGGMDALLSPTVIQGLDAPDGSGQHFEAEVAYGFPTANDRLTMTPEVALALSPTSRTYGLLWSLAPYSEQGQGEPWEIALEAERQERNSATSPVDHSLTLSFSLAF